MSIMDKTLKSLSAMAFVGAGLALASPAMAEMGTSPSEPGSMYFTAFGGYVNSDGTATPGHGRNVNTPNFLVEAEDGGFGGVTLGYVFGTPVPFGLTNFRGEATFAVSGFSDDEISNPTGSILDLNGVSGVINFPVQSEQSRDVYDGSLALKGDMELGPDLGMSVGLEVFVRKSEDETTAVNSAGNFRTHDVDALFYGAMVVVQPEFAITPSLSLVGDLGVGLYGVDADVDSRSFVAATALTFADEDSTVGFRGRANGGLKFNATDSISLTVFGGVDFWSDVPVANQRRTQIIAPGVPPRTKFTDLVELKAGLSLTFVFGGAPN